MTLAWRCVQVCCSFEAPSHQAALRAGSHWYCRSPECSHILVTAKHSTHSCLFTSPVCVCVRERHHLVVMWLVSTGSRLNADNFFFSTATKAVKRNDLFWTKFTLATHSVHLLDVCKDGCGHQRHARLSYFLASTWRMQACSMAHHSNGFVMRNAFPAKAFIDQSTQTNIH